MQYLVHIGYPKAASTWLQSTVFAGVDPRIKPLRSNVHKIGQYQKPGGQLFFSHDDHEQAALTPGLLHPFVFAPEVTKQAIADLTPSDCHVTCLSNEAWAGHPFSGGIQAREFADRIHVCLPDAKVLIVIRRQEDMLLSVYAHFLTRSYGTAGFDNFLRPNAFAQIPLHSPLFYRYDLLVQYYTSLFGRDRVLVLPCELLRKGSGRDFIAPIYSFMNLPPPANPFGVGPRNATDYTDYVLLRSFPFLNLLGERHPANGYAAWGVPAARQAFLLLFRQLAPSKWRKLRIRRDLDLIATFIRPYAIDANRALQEYTQFDLRDLGYTFG